MDAEGQPPKAPLTVTDLAGRAKVRLGEALVNPAARTMTGPGGTADVEPRVMQVLIVLADAAGEVVTRETLFQRCWGDVYVGEDSLNRVIAALRKLAAEIAGGSFSIETITRTGYRLALNNPPVAGDDGNAVGGSAARRAVTVSRRVLVGGGFAAAAAGIGVWWLRRPRTDARTEPIIERGEAELRYGLPSSDARAVESFKQAVAVRPDDPRALGLLACAQLARSQSGPRAQAGLAVQDAERAARTALALDSRQADALTALVLIERSWRDRAAIEDGLRQVLAIAPDNPRALAWIDRLLQSAGRCQESWRLSEHLISIEPVSPAYLFRRALKLWVFGRTEEAQRLSLSIMDLWPSHALVRMARLMICAFTDRTHEARALVDEEEARPILLTSQGISMWRASLAALETRSAAAVETARKESLAGARSSAALAAYAMMVMAAVGELDAAFQIAEGSLLSRGSVVLQSKPRSSELWVDAPEWRNTLGLFTPPAKAMRLDPRFAALCDGLGLTEYWRKRGIGPDAFLMRA